ncbi:unnamed protein product [Citrullus colocynthis]|uniref:Uncharacterized protein n=1 Tax=Citrullus colocynthis TaxID=252529 RepID=A0ABP0ZAW8_9ROSI
MKDRDLSCHVYIYFLGAHRQISYPVRTGDNSRIFLGVVHLGNSERERENERTNERTESPFSLFYSEPTAPAINQGETQKRGCSFCVSSSKI